MSNDHGSVRCLRRNIRVLEISSNVDFDQWFVVCDDQQVVAPLCEVLRLFEFPSHGEGFTFDRRITLFG